MSLSGTVMVVHGPEVIDSGMLGKLVACCRPARIVIAGIMARAAAEESGIPVEYAGEPPSRVMTPLGNTCYLVTQGRSSESGRIFGGIVSRRLPGGRLVQVECTAGRVILWNRAADALADELSAATGYPQVSLSGPSRAPEGVRTIRGCVPGDPVFVNGIIIGHATARTVVLSCADGTPVPVSGLDPKPHGIEKLTRAGSFDPATAWCKSGPIRNVLPLAQKKPPRGGRILVLDHCAHELYRRIDGAVVGVLAIGDDTTAACGHLCAHLGIPVLGVVDRDRDGIVPEGYAPGSVILEVVSGRDDDLGREIAGMVSGCPVQWEDWLRAVLLWAGGRAVVIRPPELPVDCHHQAQQ